MRDSYGRTGRSSQRGIWSNVHLDVCTKTLTYLGNDGKRFLKEMTRLGIRAVILDERSIQLESEKDLDLVLARIPGGAYLDNVKRQCSMKEPPTSSAPSSKVVEFGSPFVSPLVSLTTPLASQNDALLQLYKYTLGNIIGPLT